MSRDDWFRNRTWSDKIASQFEAKLKRARRKGQYIRIQACTLAEEHPEVALQLLKSTSHKGIASAKRKLTLIARLRLAPWVAWTMLWLHTKTRLTRRPGCQTCSPEQESNYLIWSQSRS